MESRGIEGLILAGGSGRRLGGPKALIPFRGAPLLLRVAERLSRLCSTIRVSTRRDLVPRLEPFGFPIVCDEDSGAPNDSPIVPGPLAGILAGCRAATRSSAMRVVVVAVDHPFLSAALLAEEIRVSLAGPFDAVLPGPPPDLEPLHAVYEPRRVAAGAACAAASGIAAVHRMLASPDLSVRWLSRAERERFDPGGRSLLNVNTPDELARAETLDS